MLDYEPDDEASIIKEIQDLEKELEPLGHEVYKISMKHKFLNHRLADLKYKLSQIQGGNDNGL